jgi:hypothetical protein
VKNVVDFLVDVPILGCMMNNAKGNEGESMRVGNVVMVYEDPITCYSLEGQAELIKKVRDGDNNLQVWEVRFEGEQETFERSILVKV